MWNRRLSAAGAGGVEPPTTRLTVERSAIELHPITPVRAVTPVLPVVREWFQKCDAQAGGRTRIPLRVGDFESPASASSATWARVCAIPHTARGTSVVGCQTDFHRAAITTSRQRAGNYRPSGGRFIRRMPGRGSASPESRSRRPRCKSCMLRRNSSCKPR